MNTAEKIKNAASPQAAMLALAEALDRIEAKIGDVPQAADPWAAAWPGTVGGLFPEAANQQVEAVIEGNQRHKQAIDEVKQQLAACADGEERQALAASLRLLQDTGAGLESVVPDGRRTTIGSDGSTGEVVIPPPTTERMAARYRWAEHVHLHEFLPQFTAPAAADAFAKGGPAWLYLGNREAVMQMPWGARQWLVEDLTKDSPAEAHEMARDILKSQESADKDITIDAIEAISASR